MEPMIAVGTLCLVIRDNRQRFPKLIGRECVVKHYTLSLPMSPNELHVCEVGHDPYPNLPFPGWWAFERNELLPLTGPIEEITITARAEPERAFR